MRLKVTLANSLTLDPAGWDIARCTSVGTDTNVANLTDWDTASSTDIVLETITPFTNSFSNTGNYATGTHGGWEQNVWGRFNYSDASVPDPAAVIRLRSTSATPKLVPGNWAKVRLGGAWGDDTRDVLYTANSVFATYDNIDQSTPYVPPDPVEIVTQITDDGTGKGVIDITSDFAPGSTRNYLAAIEVLDDPGPTAPTISNVDGDNAVNQGQLVNIDTTNFTEVITTGDIGGTAFPSIPDNDPTDDVIQVRIPVTLADGTYDVTISGATETDTISGVTYTVTHPYVAPYGDVDTNSDWFGQKLTPDTYWRVVTPFAHGTYDFVAGAAETPPFGNDINDHFTAEAGYEGSDSEVREVMYADGTTAQYTVNIEISDGTAEVDWPFSKQIRYAATKNWTWGARHPMTGMRVRIFK